MRKFFTYLPPLVLALLGLVLPLFKPGLYIIALEEPWYLPVSFSTLGVAILFGWRFGHGKVAFFSLVLLGLLGLSVTGALLYGMTSPLYENVRVAAAVLVPLNVLGFHLLKERGVLNRHGTMRGSVVLLQLVGLAVIGKWNPEAGWRQVEPFLLGPLVKTSLASPRAGAFLLVACGMVMVITWKRSPRFGVPMLLLVALVVWYGITASFVSFPAWGEPQWDAQTRATAGFAALIGAFGSAGIIVLYLLVEYSYGSAFVDSLTRLKNRRALEHRLASLGSTFSISMVDIDHFKRVNDRYGHDTGDQALRFVAARLRRCKAGKVYRYGGEEFAIVTAGRTKKDIRAELDDLRKHIADTPFYLRGKERPRRKPRKGKKRATNARSVPITVSIGVASTEKGDRSPEETLMSADKALYRAKKKGRNRIELGR